MEPLEENYANATVILRPPRVAVLFRGDENWRAWARLTISVAGKYWGGAGFVLVPFGDSGTVDPRMMSAIQAYDPDHVVVVPIGLREYERVAPGRIPLHYGDRQIVDENERRETIENSVSLPVRDRDALQARDVLAKACTPLRNAFPGDEHGSESVKQLAFDPQKSGGWGLVPAARGASDVRVFAGAEHWQTDSALSAAIRTGILPHAQEQERAEHRAEPERADLLMLALDPERWTREVPRNLVERMNIGSTSNANTRFWFDEPSGGLTSMRQGVGSEAGAIVIGETAVDFALAYAYERLLGFGAWLTPEMLRNEEIAGKLRTAVDLAAQRINDRGEWLAVTSASLDVDGLAEIAEKLKMRQLDTNPFSAAETGELSAIDKLPDGLRLQAPSLKSGLHLLVIKDPFVTSLSVPVSVEQDGTTTLRAALPTPTPAHPMLIDGSVRPYWYVGVDLSDTMPRTRSVPQTFVVADPQRYTNNGVRSGREGLVYYSQGGGLLMGGTPLEHQLFKPRVRTLGMRPWVQAMAAQAGIEARLSQPGAHAQLISRRLGGRQELMSLVSSMFHPALCMFATQEQPKRTDEVFPEHDGVVLGRDPYPSFRALERVLPGVSTAPIRGWVERLAGADLLRRGFILNCQDCTRPSFVGLDEAAQRYQCIRCSATNELSAARWNTTEAEPPWFYDLHPTFRELMAKNGYVALLMAERLRRASRAYADVAEMQFHRPEKRHPFAEIDLIAHTDGAVLVVEAKSNGRLDNSKEDAQTAAKKKVEVAVALRADKVVVATTAERWVEGTHEALEEAISKVPGASGLELDLVTGLKPDPIPSAEQ